MSFSCFVQGWIIVNTHKKKLDGHFYLMNIFRSLKFLCTEDDFISLASCTGKFSRIVWHKMFFLSYSEFLQITATPFYLKFWLVKTRSPFCHTREEKEEPLFLVLQISHCLNAVMFSRHGSNFKVAGLCLHTMHSFLPLVLHRLTP